MIDLHVHTRLCGHAVGEIEDYVEAAFEGDSPLEVLGISEHLPLPEGFEDPVGDCTMAASDLIGYIDRLRKLRQKYPSLLIGGELDYIRGYGAYAKSLSRDPHFDYVIGSVHMLSGWVFDYSPHMFERGLESHYGGDPDACILDYFSMLRMMLSECDIDIVGHFDLIKKFNVDGKYFSQDEGAYAEEVEKTLALIARMDVLLEVNTAGLRKPCNEMYPADAIIGRCQELGIGMTLGSDAHSPQEVGCDFERALKALRDAGFDRIHYVRGRKRESISLE